MCRLHYSECRWTSGIRVMIFLLLGRSIAGSLDRSLDRSIARSITRSIARSLPRSLARSKYSGVRISNNEDSGELFGESNFELLAFVIFISPVSEFRITFHKNYKRTLSLFQGVSMKAQYEMNTLIQHQGASEHIIFNTN